jgi:polysaccharide biosynthesis/export protein
MQSIWMSARSSVRSASRRAALLCLALFVPALLAGCAGTRGGPIPYNPQNFGEPDSPTVQTVAADYKLAPADTVHVSVFQVDDLSGDFEVDLLGNISLPLIGSVKAADLTTTQLDQLLTARLGEKYLQNPDVSVALKSSARRNVTVDGAVGTPGMYPVNGPTTLIQAIAMARGVTQDSNAHRVAIFRQVQGKRMAAAFDLFSIRKGEMQDPPVYAGDIIVVDGSKIKQVYNQVLMTLPIVGLFNPIIY